MECYGKGNEKIENEKQWLGKIKNIAILVQTDTPARFEAIELQFGSATSSEIMEESKDLEKLGNK